MNFTHNNICELYGPIRNSLSNVCIADSLFVVWAYTQHIQFNMPFPSEIEVRNDFLNKKHMAEKGVYSWELELITKEILLNSQEGYNCSETLRRWATFAEVMNSLKILEEAISKAHINKNNILIELHRMAHRQFPWQSLFFRGQLIRYYKIFNHPGIKTIVYNRTGLTLDELYLLGYSFFSFYLKTPAIVYPIDMPIKILGNDNVEKFLHFFSKELSEIKSLIAAEHKIDDKYSYSYSSLRAFPLIKMMYRDSLSIVCPLPTLLFWRITAGLYYEILHENNFGTYFGEAYQCHVGEIINTSNSKKKICCIPENTYYVGKDQKATADWIVYDDEAAIFIECKTKRLVHQAKVELSDSSTMQSEMEKMAQFILQAYKTIDDYRNNHYPALKFNENIHIYPLIVTLEDWYLLGFQSVDVLKELLSIKFHESNLPISYLDEMPYSICSTEEFEQLMQIVQIFGINSVLKDKVYNKEEQRWGYKAYLNEKYENEIKGIKYMFDKDYKNLFVQMINSINMH